MGTDKMFEFQTKCVPKKQQTGKQPMKKKITMSIAASALLLAGLLVSACSSTNNGQGGVHKMGSAPMSDAKMPGR